MTRPLLICALLFGPCFSVAGAQGVREPLCTLERTDHYLCHRDSFLHAFAAAKAVRLDTGRMDRFGSGQMKQLMDDLGKEIAGPEQRPDLVFELAPIDHTGRIDFGPGDVPLARLNVYDPSRGSGDHSLLWVETLDGQEDRPWPSVVTDLLRQFQRDALRR